MRRQNGGPINPQPENPFNGNGDGKGMSRRQWLAGVALGGYNANPDLTGLAPEDKAEMAFKDADAMLTAEEGQTDQP